jgi:transcription regulator
MNKSERINDMMLFLNDRSSFNLKDIMEKYNISRSTALRDISSLEEIGMPIYSQTGRNGYYRILPNKLLSPIVFNTDEIFSLYFSMLTLKAYETTPFHLSIEKLKEKFERCLPSDKIELIHKTEKVLSFGTVKQVNHCEFLKDILEFTLDEKICRIEYSKNNVIEQYYLQFFNISSKYGQWYAIGYNFKTEDYKVFRCDKILNMEESTEYSSKSLSELVTSYDISLKKKGYTEFEIEISKAGADIFYKENYPSMKLFHENGKYFIRGFYNAEEENFITEYFMNYGKNILSIKPFFLKNLIITRIKNLENYFSYNL